MTDTPNSEQNTVISTLNEQEAFTRGILEQYEADITENGSIEHYTPKGSTHPRDRVRPVVWQYCRMIKQYMRIVNQITRLTRKR